MSFCSKTKYADDSALIIASYTPAIERMRFPELYSSRRRISLSGVPLNMKQVLLRTEPDLKGSQITEPHSVIYRPLQNII